MLKPQNYILTLLFLLLGFTACEENPDDIEYAPGYPTALADNWIIFEFQGGSFEGDVLDPYRLVTALDPNDQGSLIIDRLYNADVRVRAEISDTAFSVLKGEQLERINTNTYGVEYISLRGYVTTNPVLTYTAWTLANAFFENIAFYESDIEDVILIRAGYYDAYEAIVDTVLMLGYRKTGFENVAY